MKRYLVTLLLPALLLTACGEKHEAISGGSGAAQPFTLMLDWFPNADHVGIYQGLADGEFTRSGIDLHVQVPNDPATPLQLVAAG